MNFALGIIEGFYGREWPHQERLDTLAWMPSVGLDTYVYAPKSDRALRREWRQGHTPESWRRLLELRAAARTAGVAFGVGFSPWGLQRACSEADARALRAAVRRLNELAPDLLCILFDDMPGGSATLAARQLDVVGEVLAVSTASQHAVCPTYYSQDPVLEELFGPMPGDYLRELGTGLPQSSAILWTGRKVLSPGYRHSDIDWVRQRTGREVLLWDNYPANDGRVSSAYLHLRPFSGRPPELRDWCCGHLANPMNQPALSRLVLASLGEIYQQSGYTRERGWRALLAHCPEPLAALLQRDVGRFQDQGREALSPSVRAGLSAEYRALGLRGGDEVADWLDGKYGFDPHCLND